MWISSISVSTAAHQAALRVMWPQDGAPFSVKTCCYTTLPQQENRTFECTLTAVWLLWFFFMLSHHINFFKILAAVPLKWVCFHLAPTCPKGRCWWSRWVFSLSSIQCSLRENVLRTSLPECGSQRRVYTMSVCFLHVSLSVCFCFSGWCRLRLCIRFI